MASSNPPVPPSLAGVSRRLAISSLRAIKTASPQALTQLLRSPVRGLVLDAIFWHAARQLSRLGSSRAVSTVRVHVTQTSGQEPDTYDLRWNNGRCQVTRTAAEAKPDVTVALDDAELVRLITGQSTPAQGVFNDRIMVRGDLTKAAAALASVFRSQPSD